MLSDGIRDRLSEPLAIDRQRGSRRHAARVGGPHHERTETPHFFFEKADGVVELVAAKGVAADELGETIGFVDSSRPGRPHLEELHLHAPRRGLPRRLGSGEPSPDDGDHAAVTGSSSERE